MSYQTDELAQTLFEEAGDGLFLFDPEAERLLDVNPMAQRLTGFARADLLAMTVGYLFRSESPGGLARLHRAYRTTGLFHSQEGFLLRHRRDGVWVPVNLTVTRLHARPRTLGLITARDISERKEAEAALRESERRYRTLFEATPLPMWVLDRETAAFLMVNDAAVAHYGYAREEFLGMTLGSLLAPPGAGPARTTRHRKKGGAVIEVEVSSHEVSFGGRPARLVVAHDVTDRNRAEESLRASEARFRALIEGSFDGIVLLDREGFINYSSPSATRIMGYPPGEFAGKHFSEFVAPEDLGEHAARHDRIVGEPGLSLPSCNRYRHKDGTWRWLEVRSTNLLDEPGVRAKVVHFRDVTERRQLEEQYQQAQKMEAVGRLAGGVAHDFNNLLTVVNGYTEMMLGSLAEGESLRGYAEQVRRAGARGASLTRQLLAFSRKQVLVPAVLDLNELLREMELMLGRLIGEDVGLRFAPGRGLWRVKVDPGQMEQVVMNLAVNARDAMPGGGELTIETANVEPGGHVLVSVRDTGCGMTPEVKARVFEPFFTTKGEKGTGLGLATVYGIVEQSGGRVEVDSEPGRGTTFRVYLPRASEGAATPEGAVAPKAAPRRGTETVLLVEDEDGVRRLVRLTLEMHGYRVLEACDGGAALEVCRGRPGPVHLMVTDMVMPVMGGRELAERAAPLVPGMKVLYLSGYTEDAIIRQGVNGPDVPFLQKPFTPEALARKVREVLDAPPAGG